MNRVVKSSELKHYGILGMKWGVRKDYSRVKKLYRISKTPDETNIPDGYYTTSAKEAKSFNNFVRDNKIPGVKVYNMKVKLKDVIVTPSEKEEVDIQLELLKNKKIKDIWSNEIARTKMESFEFAQKHQALEEYEEYVDYFKNGEAKKELGARYDDVYAKFKKNYAKAKQEYANEQKNVRKNVVETMNTATNQESLIHFSMAVFGSPKLRQIYRETMLAKGYNAVEDRWGQAEKNTVGSNKPSSPSAIMILDKRIFKTVKVK